MSTDPQPVRIAWGSPFKAPSVLVGEQLITEATRVTVDCQTGGAPKIFLEFEGQQVEDLQLEGVVHIVREIPADPLLAVQEFLDNLDADELNKAVLSDLEFGGSETFSEAALKVLRGWARGDQPVERQP
jgi:hypothetical protein